MLLRRREPPPGRDSAYCAGESIHGRRGFLPAALDEATPDCPLVDAGGERLPTGEQAVLAPGNRTEREDTVALHRTSP